MKQDSTIGDYVALVEVHAAVQLQRDTFALSLDVAAALGRPDRGATLLLHHSRRIGLPVRRPGAYQHASGISLISNSHITVTTAGVWKHCDVHNMSRCTVRVVLLEIPCCGGQDVSEQLSGLFTCR